MSKLLSIHLSTPTLRFKPGQAPETFEVEVSNYSREFASFKLDLEPSGVDPSADSSWYELTPSLSAKIPAGDRTRFSVTLLDVPPVPGGFVGTMMVTVRAFSLELRQEERRDLHLIIEGTGVAPPKLELPPTPFDVLPQQRIEIPVRVLNPNRSAITVKLRLQGLKTDWFPEGHERRVQVEALGETSTVFLCQIPSPVETISQVYPFEVEATVIQAAIARASGLLLIRPDGWIEFDITPYQQTLPTAKWNQPSPPAPYALQCSNQSNVPQQITLAIDRRTRPFWQLLNRTERQPLRPSDRITVLPQPAPLPIGGTTPIELHLAVKRPWLGWTRQHRFQIQPVLSDDRVALQPETREIQLHVLPRLSLWLQLLGVGLLACLVWLPYRWQPHHRGPVYAVQFNGLGTEIISASRDQTVRRWQDRGVRLRSLAKPIRSDKAVRVVRFRPVNNDAIAIGFENGDIEVFNLLSNERLSLEYERQDRVFDLQFSEDARSLFSSHGSGQLLRWDLADRSSEALAPVQQQQVDFVVQALALVGLQEQHLAIAGRFNRLMLWNWQTDRLMPIAAYPSATSSEDYITSLSVADGLSDLLAVADNQGRISLWDVSTCLDQNADCLMLNTWANGHNGAAVQSIALSADGCYLVSGGDDGRVVVWSLQADGQVLKSRQLSRSSQPVNAVDVIQQGDRLFVVSGGEDHRVRLYEVAATNYCR